MTVGDYFFREAAKYPIGVLAAYYASFENEADVFLTAPRDGLAIYWALLYEITGETMHYGRLVCLEREDEPGVRQQIWSEHDKKTSSNIR